MALTLQKPVYQGIYDTLPRGYTCVLSLVKKKGERHVAMHTGSTLVSDRFPV